MTVLVAVEAMQVYVVPWPPPLGRAVARGGVFGRPCKLGDLESAAARAAVSFRRCLRTAPTGTQTQLEAQRSIAGAVTRTARLFLCLRC